MTKTTYKVGDKVRILGTENIFLGEEIKIVGGYAEVESVSNEGHPRLACRDGAPLIIAKSELQYIEKIEESDAKMTQFKVGYKVRVIGVGAAGLPIGTEAKVTQVDWDGGVYLDIKNVHGNKAFYLACNIELVSPKPTKNQRISALEKEVETLKAEIDVLKAAQKPADITKIAEGITKMFAKEKKLTPNERRKAIIDEAKAFIAENTVFEEFKGTMHHGVVLKSGAYVKPVYWVLPEKRIVEVNMVGVLSDKSHAKGIAKCAPGDVFNADIGKAIALGRALGLDVERFEKAVQPSEVVVGHIIDTKRGGGNWTATVTKMYPSRDGYGYGKAFEHSHDDGWLGEDQVTIIDDTEAKY